MKHGTYKEHFVVDKPVTIVGEEDDEGNCPVIWDSLKKTDTCIHVNAPATLRNLAVTTKTKVDHDSLDFEDGRHYEAIYVTADATLDNVSAYGWFDDGVRVDGEGVEPVIENCRFFDNRGMGLNFTGGAAGSVSRCEIYNNDLANIAISDESTSPCISDCEIHSGKSGGIFLYEGASGTIENCDIFENKLSGIEIGDEGTNPTVSACQIHNGKDSGIFINEGASGTIENCDIFENADSGIYIQDEGTGPTVSACQIHNGEAEGIYVADEASPTIVDCESYDNAKPDVLPEEDEGEEVEEEEGEEEEGEEEEEEDGEDEEEDGEDEEEDEEEEEEEEEEGTVADAIVEACANAGSDKFTFPGNANFAKKWSNIAKVIRDKLGMEVEEENALAILDCTVFGSAKNGVLFDQTGIYLMNDWTASDFTGFVSWEDFAEKGHVVAADQYIVQILENRKVGICVAGCDLDTPKTVALFNQILQIVKGE